MRPRDNLFIGHNGGKEGRRRFEGMKKATWTAERAKMPGVDPLIELDRSGMLEGGLEGGAAGS